MNANEAKKILDKIVGQVFGFQNPLTLEQAMQKFAFDVRLPQQVFDASDGTPTWAASTNPTKFMKMENRRNNETKDSEGLYAKQPINSLQELLEKWNAINYATTEREIDSLNVAESDDIIRSENVFRSSGIQRSKNVLFSEDVHDSEFIVAGQRAGGNTFCMRIQDSGECSNSFEVSWSSKITNCMFIHDASDMQDSMFCTNIRGKQYCVANMQFTKEEYEKLRAEVIQWILSPQG